MKEGTKSPFQSMGDLIRTAFHKAKDFVTGKGKPDIG